MLLTRRPGILSGVSERPRFARPWDAAKIPLNDLSTRRFAMANYVDGFVVPVPKKNIDAYRKMSRKAGKVWREYGALEYRECVADDVKPGKYTSFPQSVKLKPNEVVWFSWIVYKSRKHRDQVNAKVMKDPRLANMMDPKALPFDGKRMFWGGFKVAVDV
jgi:uncharacterized protein YbaA (DUF1428 family)